MERFRAYALLTVAALILWAGAWFLSSPHTLGVAFAETIGRPSQATSTDATLAWLTLEDVPFTFSSGPTSYTASVGHAVEETIVRTSTTRHRASYVVKVDNVVKNGLFPLSVGANVNTIEVTAEEGESKQTYTVTVTRAAAPTATPPQNNPTVSFSVTGIGDDWIGVRWRVPGNRGITSYEVAVNEYNGSEIVFSDGHRPRSQGTPSGGSGYFARSFLLLKPNTLYKVVLTLGNADNEIVIGRSVTARTNEAPAATPTPVATPPPAPVLAAKAEAGAVELSWDAVTGAVRYELWTWTSEGGWQQIGGNSLTATAFRHDGLAAGTTYFYSARTHNSAGQTSPWSEYVSATVPAGQ